MEFYLNEQQVSFREATNSTLAAVDRADALNILDTLKKEKITEQLIDSSTDYVSKATGLVEVSKANPTASLAVAEAMLTASLVQSGENPYSFALAIHEATAGSDLSDIRTKAERRENGYILTGEKAYIFYSDMTEYFITLCNIGSGRTGLICVPADHPDLVIAKSELSGAHGVQSATVRFDHAEFSHEALLQEITGPLEELLNLQSFYYAAISIGIAEAALEKALEHSRSRVQFGKPIGEFQAIQFKIAETTVGINAAKTLLYDAAQQLDRGETALTAIYSSKVYGTETAGKSVNHAFQIIGSLATVADSEIAQLYQFQRMLEVYGQTSEILRIKTAEEVLHFEKEEVYHGI